MMVRTICETAPPLADSKDHVGLRGKAADVLDRTLDASRASD
jgi:hypothetical protein